MSLRIRQIVVAARDLRTTVAQFEAVLGVRVCYRDPEVGAFGLENALMLIGDQFLEVVSPIRDHTAAGRHIARHGDSGYMLILQTDDLTRDRARLERLGVRLVWQASYPDVSAVHLHPKDIGAAIVSLDQPVPPDSWRWAGPGWQQYATRDGAQRVLDAMMTASDPHALAQRWATVLATHTPIESADNSRIEISGGTLAFERAAADVIGGFGIAMASPQAALTAARAHGLPVTDHTVTICGTQFRLSQAVQ
jgi:hypothetical protein